jgi:D-3-phosphoglycerate dehydrogenase
MESDFREIDNPLLKLDNVLLTPHLGWYSEDALTDLQGKATEEVVRVLQGSPPKNLVNKQVLS